MTEAKRIRVRKKTEVMVECLFGDLEWGCRYNVPDNKSLPPIRPSPIHSCTKFTGIVSGWMVLYGNPRAFNDQSSQRSEIACLQALCRVRCIMIISRFNCILGAGSCPNNSLPC